MDPPPPPSSHHAYPDSVESSPRSRNTDSWDDPLPPPPSMHLSPKLRLMCSYGGRIVPRPHDKALCYLGGDTRIVVVDRHASLADLSARLSRTFLDGQPFALKYQLPSEDLDSLISVSTDEDLENMVDEYDRTAAGAGAGKPSRLRFFLFPAKPDSAASSSIGSLLDDSKSETWFVDALNGAGVLPRGLSSDSNSVNCLLGLEDAAPPPALAADADPRLNVDPLSEKPAKQQEFHSVPDSPMVETGSSFGSGSSARGLAGLPPIRVHFDGRAGLEEQFAAVMAAKAEDGGFKDGNFAANPPIPSAFLTATAVVSPPGEISNVAKVLSEDERSDPGVGSKKASPQPIKAVANSDTIPRDNQMEVLPTKQVIYSDAMPSIPLPTDQGYRMPAAVHDPSLVMTMQQAEQHHQPQPQAHQFVHPGAHYIQHGAAGVPAPVPYTGQYYIHHHQPPPQPQQVNQQQQYHQVNQQQHHQVNQQQQYQQVNQQQQYQQVYFVPVRQNPPTAQTLKPQQPTATTAVHQQVYPTRTAPPTMPSKTDVYRPPTAPVAANPDAQPPLIQLADHSQQQYVGYHQSGMNYGYDYVDPAQSAIYFTQPTNTQLTATSHYQTLVSPATLTETAMTSPPGGVGEAKLQNRS